MKKQVTPLSEIMSVAANHFGISEEDLQATGGQTQEVNLARTSAIFVAARADYSNADIAEVMGYKSPNTVSSKFEKSMKSYQNLKTDDDKAFVSTVRALAKHAHVTLD